MPQRHTEEDVDCPRGRGFKQDGKDGRLKANSKAGVEDLCGEGQIPPWDVVP